MYLPRFKVADTPFYLFNTSRATSVIAEIADVISSFTLIKNTSVPEKKICYIRFGVLDVISAHLIALEYFCGYVCRGVSFLYQDG